MHEEWELVSSTKAINTYRMEVPGGWLYYTAAAHKDAGNIHRSFINMTFVPRPPELTNPLVAQYILDIANEAKQ